MSHALGQSFPVLTMDQQLYCIAKQVMWHLPNEFNNHTVRFGGFHTQFSFISSIGQLWGGGLRDLLIDSGVLHLPPLTECCLESNINVLFLVCY